MPRDRQRRPADTDPRTLLRRGPHSLTPTEVRTVKQLRDRLRWSFAKIGAFISKPAEEVRVALAPTRSRHPDPKRASISVKPQQVPNFLAFAPLEGEARHATFGEVLRLAWIGKEAEAAGFRPPEAS